jgi:hypothetical protein
MPAQPSNGFFRQAALAKQEYLSLGQKLRVFGTHWPELSGIHGKSAERGLLLCLFPNQTKSYIVIHIYGSLRKSQQMIDFQTWSQQKNPME